MSLTVDYIFNFLLFFLLNPTSLVFGKFIISSWWPKGFEILQQLALASHWLEDLPIFKIILVKR